MIWLLIGYMWLFIHRPFEIWPILGEMRIELLYMLLVGAVWLSYPAKRLSGNVLHLAFVAFAVAMLLCTVLSPCSDVASETLDTYIKFLVFYLLLVTVIHDEQTLKRLSLAYLVVMSLYLLHSLWEYKNGKHVARMGIIRMVGVDSSFGDPNAFGTSIVLALVFVPAVWGAYSSKLVRYFLMGFIALSGLCIALTGSRGSFLCLVIWAGIAIWNSRYRKHLMLAAAVCVPLLWIAMPGKMQARFESILFPEVVQKNAQLSAEARIIGLQVGVQLFQDNPVNGIGPGAWTAYTGRKLKAHNLYGQLLGEMGGLGAMTFCGIIAAFVVNLLYLRRAYRAHPEWSDDFLGRFSFSIGIALFLLLLQGNFGHNLYRYQWVWFGAFLAIVRHCMQQRMALEAAGAVQMQHEAIAEEYEYAAV
jgi:hypothetical protein